MASERLIEYSGAIPTDGEKNQSYESQPLLETLLLKHS